MKLGFTKKRLYSNLISGILFTTLGIVNILGEDNLRWLDYLILIGGIIYILHYFYDLIVKYLTIEGGFIWLNGFYEPGDKIKLDEIDHIRKFGGTYTLKTKARELKINTSLIEDKSLVELDRILEELDL